MYFWASPMLFSRSFLRSRCLVSVTLGAIVFAVAAIPAGLWGQNPQPAERPAGESNNAVRFGRDVRPLLVEHCAACHGGVKQAGGLSFNFKERVFGKADSDVPIVIPREPANSLMIQRVTADEENRMPPADHGKRLTAEEVATLRNWIEQGANWEEHWSFMPPQAHSVPQVKQVQWVRKPVDAFVLAGLEARGLSPSPEAGRLEWLRRVSFDLTGLPPAITDIDAFLADDSPTAHEKVVDRLLASSHYGERWASIWMDQARYADSQGYERDNLRTMWPYRDWLIRALNEDLPYDQFILRQIAGDLLPEGTLSDVIATAFHRNSPTNAEGGTDDEEFRVAAVLDRVNTTWQAVQGVTFQCTQCHDHPYAAFKNEDYYRFMAYFNTSRDWDLTDDAPQLAVPEKLEDFALARDLDRRMEQLRQEEVTQGNTLSGATPWKALLPVIAKSTGVTELVLKAAEDGVVEVHTQGTVAHNSRFTLDFVAPEGMDQITAIRLDALPRDPQTALRTPELGFVITEVRAGIVREGGAANAAPAESAPEGEAAVPGAENPPAAAPAENPPAAENSAAQPAVEPGANPPAEEGAAGGRRGARFGGRAGVRGGRGPGAPGARGNTVDVGQEEIRFRWAIGDEVNSFAAAQDSLNGSSKGGWGAKPRINVPRRLVLIPETPVKLKPGERLRIVLRQEDAPNDMMPLVMNRSRYSVSSDPRWTELAGDAAFKQRRETLAQLSQQRQALGRTMLLVMSEQDAALKRTSAMFTRGVWLDKGKDVTPGIPELFGTLPVEWSADRLGMAQWLVSEKNPLAARVAVNRVWENLFGLGIVETQEDFGPSGLLPSHPELLDDLAVRFRRDHVFSQKSLLRELVLSATYRQAASGTPASREKDPRNQWLSRGPRLRLTAEMVRDSALAASGLLTDKLFGPPVTPPQEETMNAPYSGAVWKNAEGPDRYRRALYTRWRRSNAYASMVTFDAPNRLVCVSRRVATNTPLQALVTLNDTVYMECATSLGKEMQKNGGSGPGEQIAYGYRRVTSQAADEATLAELLKLYELAREQYQRDAELAKAMGGTPESAALAIVGNALLNLDDALSR